MDHEVSTLIRKLDDVSSGQAAIAGGKGASLGELLQAGAPVPPAFIVTSAAFAAFTRAADPDGEVDDIVRRVATGTLQAAEASARVISLLHDREVPVDVSDALHNAVTVLGSPRLCVRSSATCEDGDRSAWAGQLETYLGVAPADVLDKVRACWLSAFSESALAYGAAHGYGAGRFSVAVVVQEMVSSEVSGIGFSVHPVTQEPNIMLIEACLGLGEAIVSGQIAPDQYAVAKDGGGVAARLVGRQKKALFAGSQAEPVWRELGEEGALPKLSDSQVLEYADLLTRIENHFGHPVDTEWAWSNGRFNVLQARPITTLAPEYRESVVESGVDWQPLIRRPMSLLEVSTWAHWLDSAHANGALGVSTDKLLAIQDENDIANLLLEAKFGDRIVEHLVALHRNDRHALVQILDRGHEVYQKGRDRFESRQPPTLDEACELFIEALQYTGAIPYLILASDIDDQEIRSLAEELRSKTLYPFVERHFIEPAAADLTRQLGFSTPEHAAEIATWMELRRGRLDRETLESRWESVQRSERFVFQVLPEGERVRFVSQTGYLIMRSAHRRELQTSQQDEIKGQAAWPGVHRGRARVVLSADATGQTIEPGEVLVSIQSSPALMPLLTRAGAIITDEGGLACHAAIICRELKIPTLIGTDTATQVIRTGDLVEVDCYEQAARILERGPAP